MPMPAMALSVKTPPLGNCSEVSPNVVLHRKVLPSAYTASATIAPMNVSMPLTIRRPMAKPSG